MSLSCVSMENMLLMATTGSGVSLLLTTTHLIYIQAQAQVGRVSNFVLLIRVILFSLIR